MKKFVIILVSVLFSAIAYSQSPVLVAHYPFNYNFADSTGNTSPNLISGNAQYVSDSGHVGLHFNGTNEYIDIINTSIVTSSSDFFILSMWVKLDNDAAGIAALVNGDQNLITFGGYSIPNNFQSFTFGLYNDGNPNNPRAEFNVKNIEKLNSEIRTQMGWASPIQPLTLQNSWFHIVVLHDIVNDSCGGITYEYSKNNYKFFLNGIPTSQYNGNPNVCVTPINMSCVSIPDEEPNFPVLSKISIGRVANKYFKGTIDDVRIYTISGSDTSNYILIDSLFNNPPLSTNIFDIDYKIDYSVYPNPSHNGTFNILTNETEGYTYSITDITGRIMQTGIISEKQLIVNLSSCSKGLYFLRVEDKHNNISTSKLLYQ